MSQKPKPVATLLQTRPQLARLDQAIRQRQLLLQTVRKALPDDLATHCTSASLEQGRLCLLCDSSAWASRLRYMVPQLLSSLRTPYPGLANIEIHVAQQGIGGPARRGASLPRPSGSQVAARTVEETAQGLAGEPLSRALLRLARTLRER